MSWAEVRFGDLYLGPSRNGLTRPRSSRGSGYKMINMGEIFGYDRIGCIPMERVLMSSTEIEKFSVSPLDLMFARQSMVAEGAGKCSLVTAVDETTCFESHLIRVRLDQRKADPRFFHLYFQSPLGRSRVEAIVTGAAQKGIRGSELQDLIVHCPPLDTQRRIASILSAYDDLIENNTRRIAILEEIARRIYEEWFVRFRFPGHEQVKIVESELGLIPEGWKTAPLSGLVTTQYGYTESTQDTPIGPKFLRGMDINKQTYIDWSAVPYCPISDVELPKFRLSKGDVLVIRMADPGKVGIVEKDVSAVFASYLVRLRIIDQRLTPYFLFYFLTSDRYQGYITGASTGTTRKSASAPVITGIDVVLPPPEIMGRFVEQVSLLRSLLNNLLEKNANLRTTRDLLLPKLISGELDVSTLPAPEEAIAA